MAEHLPAGDLLFREEGNEGWEFYQFLMWITEQYGAPTTAQFTLENFKATEHYRYWVQNVRDVTPSWLRGIDVEPTTPENLEEWRETRARGGTHLGYTEWLRMGKPGFLTPAEVAAEVRPAVTPEGIIPYVGFEGHREYLESIGYELVEEDEFGPLPDEAKFYQRAVVEPEEPEEEGTVIIPGQLKVMPDGTYVSLLSMLPVDTETASLMIADFQRAMAAPDIGWQPGLEQWEREFEAEEEWRRLQMEEAARARRGEAGLRREEILAGLTGPRDWIRYWQMRQGPGALNPRIANLHSEAMGHLNAAQGLSGNERLREEMAAEKLFDKADELRHRQQEMPATPPSPQWLPQHLIGGAPGVGEPIEALQVRTPSPQLLGGMAETERLGLAGFADWQAPVAGGRTWLDVLGHMEQMIPEGVRGGDWARWAPVHQRAPGV